MFERYRAMFSLRNRGGPEAVKELGNALGKPVVFVAGVCYHYTAKNNQPRVLVILYNTPLLKSRINLAHC